MVFLDWRICLNCKQDYSRNCIVRDWGYFFHYILNNRVVKMLILFNFAGNIWFQICYYLELLIMGFWFIVNLTLISIWRTKIHIFRCRDKERRRILLISFNCSHSSTSPKWSTKRRRKIAINSNYQFENTPRCHCQNRASSNQSPSTTNIRQWRRIWFASNTGIIHFAKIH